MTRKVEDLTDAELDVLVAERVKGWQLNSMNVWDGSWAGADCHWQAGLFPPWQPSTDIACAFQVDKPEWEWAFFEYPTRKYLIVKLWLGKTGFCHTRLPLDPANKAAAYCRGRCIAACYACGITEV